MTTYLLAPDSFKESMTSRQVCEAMAFGIKQADPNASIISVPLADGGEGTTDALVSATHGTFRHLTVTGSLGKSTAATYGILGDSRTAVIEMAMAGELIKDALGQDIDCIIIGLGGSSTNDAGAGMAQALGAHLLDSSGQELPVGGGALKDLARIDVSELDPRLKQVEIILASDVTNPLTGPQGASYVFGRQKGADSAMIKRLDQNLHHFAQIVKRDLGKDIENQPGAGAAGGLGAGLMAFADGKMQRGIELVIKLTNLEAKVQQANYIFTGEGGTDFQTHFGKAPFGVAQLGKKYHKPVISFAGYLGNGIEKLYPDGFTAFFSIMQGASDRQSALAKGPENMTRTVANVVRLLKR
ncbi:MAG: glycerate kinase [Limosilactobacillus mucosae]|nr:glycerate kinase [Limosilactobacillus mucosae]MCI6052216.1 glycerate kinase [Limosilactobacillus mucosae]MDY5413352.1 glycerate kinase [Limosilactobacillus mucosae]